MKLCVICTHFLLKFGSEGEPSYSEYTPGYPGSAGSIGCQKEVFSTYEGETAEDVFMETILTAEKCPHYEEVKPR